MELDLLISTQDAAEVLNCSVSTIKRWVDEGILPAQKTPGGHRKILMADLLRLSRQKAIPSSDLSKVLEQDLLASGSTTVNKDTFHDALVNKNQDLCSSILKAAYQNKIPVEQIADEIIGPAMSKIGHEWTIGKRTILQEHCATQMVMNCLAELRSFLNLSYLDNRPLAIGGCIALDNYLISNYLAEMVLIDQGWKTMNLGPNTPVISFLEAIEEYQPKLIWMSVSHVQNAEEFKLDNKRLFDCASRSGTILVLGGQAITPELRKSLSFHFCGDSLGQLSRFTKTLITSPALPSRGRPPLKRNLDN